MMKKKAIALYVLLILVISILSVSIFIIQERKKYKWTIYKNRYSTTSLKIVRDGFKIIRKNDSDNNYIWGWKCQPKNTSYKDIHINIEYRIKDKDGFLIGKYTAKNLLIPANSTKLIQKTTSYTDLIVGNSYGRDIRKKDIKRIAGSDFSITIN